MGTWASSSVKPRVRRCSTRNQTAAFDASVLASVTVEAVPFPDVADESVGERVLRLYREHRLG